MTAPEADPAGIPAPAGNPAPAPPDAAPAPAIAAMPGVVGQVDTLIALVAAREAKGLSADDLARKLNLAPRQVLALEAGDWPALPGQAFVRAALRSYGRQIGIDVMPLLASIGDSAGAPDLRPATSLREPMPRPGLFGFGAGGSGSRGVWIALCIALVVAIAFFFGRVPGLTGGPATPAPGAPIPPLASAPGPAGAASPDASGASAAGSAAGAPAAPAPAAREPTTGLAAPAAAPVSPTGGAAPPSAPSVPSAPPAPPPASAPAAQGAQGAAAVPPSPPASASAAFPPLVPAPASAGPSATPASPAAAAGVGELRLSFQGESWVEIRRVDGQLLHEGVQRRGSVLRVPLDAEVSVVLGNAPAVQVVHNGGPLDIAPMTRQGVARLKLAP